VNPIDIPVFDAPRTSSGCYRLHMRGDKGCLLLTPGLSYPLARAELLARSKAFEAAGWTVECFEDYAPSCAVMLTREDAVCGTLVLELRVLGGHE
jgi:hypothetical protein